MCPLSSFIGTLHFRQVIVPRIDFARRGTYSGAERLTELDRALRPENAMRAVQKVLFEPQDRGRRRRAEISPDVPDDLLVGGMYNSH
jgi:hypothetical protein